MTIRTADQGDGAAARGARAAVFALLVGLTIVLSACASASPKPEPTPPPTVTTIPSPTAPAPAPTATPDLTVLLRDGGIGVIQMAYDRLLDEYIRPLEPAPLLNAAWDGLAQEADRQGVSAPPRPRFEGDRSQQFVAFAQAYVPFATAVTDATPLRYAAIRAMAGSLGDCHTFFLNPVASETLIDSRAGKGSVGIGIELAGVPPLITEVITGGPAERAGVRVGDRIVRVDGTDTSAAGPAGALDLINGDEDTSLTLTVRRPGEAADIELSMTRARVVPLPVESRVLADGMGYVRIRNFVDGGVKEDLEAALEAFERQGVRGWIIDLRGNPGGRLDSPAISLFVRDGVIVRDRGRDGELEEIRATGDLLPSVRPTVLLTNDRTGSVSEIFAAALKEYGVAYVIGTNTYGCVGYTDVREFGDGSSMAVTTHEHLGPVTSTTLNGVGVMPDLIVGRSENDVANARDPQLDAAIAHLRDTAALSGATTP